jgi:hypothetical protein
MVWLSESRPAHSTSPAPQTPRLQGVSSGLTLLPVELSAKLDALERALTGIGIRLVEEELPEEAHVDGGLCKIGEELVVYVSPTAPPWRRAQVLQQALRQLPHGDVWLPPEIRRILEREAFGGGPHGLLQFKGQNEDER